MIIYLDTETSGLYPGEICQLSYVMQTAEGAVAKNFFFTVNEVEYGAYMVHGFSVEVLKTLSGGKRFCDNIEEIEKDFSNASLIVAHNTSFDFMFLRKEFERCGKVFYVPESFCSMKNMTAVCKLKRTHGAGYKYPRLSELCEYFDITEDSIKEKTEELFSADRNYHDARFDTVAVYLAVNAGMRCEPVMQKLCEFL